MVYLKRNGLPVFQKDLLSATLFAINDEKYFFITFAFQKQFLNVLRIIYYCFRNF